MEKWDDNASFKNCIEDSFEIIHLLFGKMSTTPTKDKTYLIQFLSEQLDLLPKKNERKCYSVVVIIFCCIFCHNIASCVRPAMSEAVEKISPANGDHPILITAVSAKIETQVSTCHVLQ